MEALLRTISPGVLVSRLGSLALVIAITVAVNEPEDWQPVELVVALAVLYAIADSVVVWARRVRLTAGMTVQMTAAALLGPGPAVAMSLVSNIVDSTANRLPLGGALTNISMIVDAGSSQAVQAGHVGLALVRRRVEDAGGAFEIATRADGGTRSRAVLPRPRERDSLQTIARRPADSVGGHKRVR